LKRTFIEGKGTHSGPELRPDDTEGGRGLERWDSLLERHRAFKENLDER